MATTTEIPVTLNKDEILRYSRHLIMPEVGMEGQQKLKAARVLCIGTGGWDRRWRCIWLRRAWARWDWSTSTWWTTPTCSGRSFTPPPTWAARSSIPRPTS